MIIAGPVIAVGWHLYEGARTPDQPILSSRREEPGRLSIAKSVFAVIAGSKPRLRNNRNDGLGDDISLTVKADRYDRVDIQDIPGLLIRPGIEVGVILERGTDQIGHRIQRGLGQCLAAPPRPCCRMACPCQAAPATLPDISLQHLSTTSSLENCVYAIPSIEC
jgi:hypothetical protein